MDRRTLLAGMAAGAVMAGPARATVPPVPSTLSARIPLAERRFTSPAVEACISTTKAKIRDLDLAAIFENCFPNTLDTTVTVEDDDTFVITGDIDAMWLRDSSAQVMPYVRLAKGDKTLTHLLAGVLKRQARCILIDPYANAFMRDPLAKTGLPWSQEDRTDMKTGVAERKWEIDSLCWPVALGHAFWAATGNPSPFQAEWWTAMHIIVHTFRTQQRKDGDGPYHFQRKAENPVDTLPLNGFGAPTRKVGLIHAGFRPSDDSCVYPFNIPGNHFAVVTLRRIADMAEIIMGNSGQFVSDCRALASEIAAALRDHGTMRLPGGQKVWAYEVDGFGNALFMDDANTPSLLSLPYLGAVKRTDSLYQATRKTVLSGANPYFFAGTAAEGTGGPHIGMDMVWPMSIMMRALTSDDDREITHCLTWLKTTTAGTGFMHEAFHRNDPANFTRPWFAWANTLFGELILDLADRKPHLL